jgi:hypothetical protein
VRLGRLNGGAQLLDTHGQWQLRDVLGVVERAWIENGVGMATVRFSRRADVDPIWQDVREGILRNISVGYLVHRVVREEREGQPAIVRAVDWEPMEISFVPVPADPGAQVRAQTQRSSRVMIETRGAAKVRTMDENQNQPAGAPAPAAPASAPAETVNVEQVRESERQRGTYIRGLGELLGMERATIERAVSEGRPFEEVASGWMSEAGARDAARIPSQRSPRPAVQVLRDGGETQRGAMVNALLHRANPGAYQLDEGAREYRYMNLLDLARESLVAQGVNVRGMTSNEIAGLAMNDSSSLRARSMSSSDFPLLLADALGKELRRAYLASPRTFTGWARRVTAADFKLIKRLQLDSDAILEKVAPGEPSKLGKLRESREQYRLETFEKRLAMTRQMIINDDLDAFSRVPQFMAREAANVESNTVYSILTTNGNMADGNPLFHANHNNLGGAVAISADEIGKGRSAMRVQKGLDGKTPLNLIPRFLVGPTTLEGKIAQIQAPFGAAQASNVVPDYIRSMVPVIEPRLDANSTTAYYLIADPAEFDTVEYCYLDGEEGVYLETKDGWHVSGMEVKARLDFAAAPIDWRGMYRSPGA